MSGLWSNFPLEHTIQEVFFPSFQPRDSKKTTNTYLLDFGSQKRGVFLVYKREDLHVKYLHLLSMLAHLMWDCDIGNCCLLVAFHLPWLRKEGGVVLTRTHIHTLEYGDSCTWDQLVSSVSTIIMCLYLQSTKLTYHPMASEMSEVSSTSCVGVPYCVTVRDVRVIDKCDKWGWKM